MSGVGIRGSLCIFKMTGPYSFITKLYQMKRIKALLTLVLLAGVMLFSSFSPKQEQHANAAAIRNLAWYTPSGEFVAWSTLANALFVSGDDLDPTGGTLDLLGYTEGDPGEPPSGTLVYELYSHP